jgi:hypothetical protein
MPKIDPNIGFQEKLAENWQKSPKIGKSRRKLAKVAENCGHNIDIQLFL